jgi:rSAM/selenodomain-associated transferase 1
MTATKPRIILQLFAKAPRAGFAKTRLIPTLGESGAAAVAKRMLENTLAECQRALTQVNDDYRLAAELWATPGVGAPAWAAIELPSSIEALNQPVGDLGKRMATAAEQGLQRAEGIILLGSDCPAITAASLHWAAKALLSHDSCMIPTFDGGYALLGLRHFSPHLFADIVWSTDTVASVTRQRIAECGMSLAEQDKVHDIDEAADLLYLPEGWL